MRCHPTQSSYDVILDEKESEIKSLIDKYEHAEKRLSEIKNKIEKRGRKDWRYSPIFRGLLLYLYNECEVVDWGKGSTKWKRRESKKYLRRVISNPLVIDEAPFLHHWEAFEEHVD